MVRSVLRWLDSPWAFELLPGLNKLGRNPTNDFRISDPSVSSFHAELLVSDDSVRVRDLGSTNGTFIDDARVDDGILKPENVLRLGSVRFVIDEVPVLPVCTVQVLSADPSAATAPPEHADLVPSCTYHTGVRAAYRCENCGGGFCADCVTIIGQGKFEATTICPVCKGQCYALPTINHEAPKPGLLKRLTQTLRLPFTH